MSVISDNCQNIITGACRLWLRESRQHVMCKESETLYCSDGRVTHTWHLDISGSCYKTLAFINKHREQRWTNFSFLPFSFLRFIAYLSFYLPLFLGLVLQLRRLVASTTLRRPWFNPRPVHVRFVVDRRFSEFFGCPQSVSFYHCSISSLTLLKTLAADSVVK